MKTEVNDVSEFTRVIGLEITGVNAKAFGLGLKDVALTLSLLAAISALAGSAFLVGCAPAPDPEGFVVACAVLLEGCAAG